MDELTGPQQRESTAQGSRQDQSLPVGIKCVYFAQEDSLAGYLFQSVLGIGGDPLLFGRYENMSAAVLRESHHWKARPPWQLNDTPAAKGRCARRGSNPKGALL